MNHREFTREKLIVAVGTRLVPAALQYAVGKILERFASFIGVERGFVAFKELSVVSPQKPKPGAADEARLAA